MTVSAGLCYFVISYHFASIYIASYTPSHTLHCTIAYIALHNCVHCIAHCALRRIDQPERIFASTYSVLLLVSGHCSAHVQALPTLPLSYNLKVRNIIMNPGTILYRMFYASSSSKRLDDTPRYVCVCSKYNQGQSHMVSDMTWRRHLEEASMEDERE